MQEFFIILISTILVNNFILAQFLGLCPFMGVSSKVENAIGMGFATAFVLTLSSFFSFLINELVLIPFEIEYLKTIAFIVVIAAVVGWSEIFIAKVSPLLHNSLGVFLPLITTNCAVLGVALLNVKEQNTMTESIVYGFGASVGFTLVLVLFATIRERLESADVPKIFKNTPIALITAGIMSLGFMGFAGIV
jgi:electron transport complex protein RnfA